MKNNCFNLCIPIGSDDMESIFCRFYMNHPQYVVKIKNFFLFFYPSNCSPKKILKFRENIAITNKLLLANRKRGEGVECFLFSNKSFSGLAGYGIRKYLSYLTIGVVLLFLCGF